MDRKHAAAPAPREASAVDISVVIPVFNEEENLPLLHSRLRDTMERLGRSYEIVFVDDGSADRSVQLVQGFIEENPGVRLVEFNRNYGQHAAVFAGFEQSRGDIVVTLDADLQNPPEEIPKLIAVIDQGYDIVGGLRQDRRDSVFRKIPSWLVNRFIARSTGVYLKDYGCPIQIISGLGILIALLGMAFGAFLFLRRILHGPEVEGVFTLFAILFVFMGIQLLAMGLIGEYIGRIYTEVRNRPRYVIKKISS
ncbi:MAG: glycosyltransferase [Candidatus Aureabacteria bacterium]|nr:glycosyltransferase [Candidatus Auribacterota bacterium]